MSPLIRAHSGVAFPCSEAKVSEGARTALTASKEDEGGPGFAQCEFLGVTFTNIGLTEALAWLRGRTSASAFAYVVTPNVDHVLNLQHDAPLRTIYARADLCLCDSRVLALLARMSGIELHVSPGSELVSLLLRSMAPGRALCVIGSSGTVAARLAELLPGVTVHCHVPPMGLRHSAAAQAEVVDFVRAHQADYILLAVGSPQQEMVSDLLRRDGRIGGTALCVGAAIQFFTGESKRAPRWMQRLSLEWAHRLVREPRRLARRYLVKGPAIFPVYARWVRARRK
jgi:N-acetylglucosaminyldiphosphoundecaprenol N-acetyl-beta-D-mannosaminyltransferase